MIDKSSYLLCSWSRSDASNLFFQTEERTYLLPFSTESFAFRICCSDVEYQHWQSTADGREVILYIYNILVNLFQQPHGSPIPRAIICCWDVEYQHWQWTAGGREVDLCIYNILVILSQQWHRSPVPRAKSGSTCRVRFHVPSPVPRAKSGSACQIRFRVPSPVPRAKSGSACQVRFCVPLFVQSLSPHNEHELVFSNLWLKPVDQQCAKAENIILLLVQWNLWIDVDSWLMGSCCLGPAEIELL